MQNGASWTRLLQLFLLLANMSSSLDKTRDPRYIPNDGHLVPETLSFDDLQKQLESVAANMTETVVNYYTKSKGHPYVYTGSAGISMLLLHLWQDFGIKRLGSIDTLETAKRLLQFSKQPGSSGVGFLDSPAGVYAIAAVIAHIEKRPAECQANVTKLVEMNTAAMTDSSSELLYGKAGFLYALDFVHNKTRDGSLIPHYKSLVANLTKAILNDGINGAYDDWPMMWQWHGTSYLGAAHGVAGILLTLFRHWDLVDKKEELKIIFEKLLVLPSTDTRTGALAIESSGARLPSGNWKSNLESQRDILVQWCHGAPGFIPLLIRGLALFPDLAGDINHALESAINVVWKRGLLKKGVGLCHGVAGNGYVFLAAFKARRNPDDLKKAIYFAQVIAKWHSDPEFHELFNEPDRPLSLFEGMAGAIYFIHDLLHVSQSCGIHASQSCGIHASQSCGIHASQSCGIHANQPCGMPAYDDI